tara:strand:+ start:1282 stop:1932 length:651 start_codon:yes stop_codon:yes gene_type:complete
MSGVADSCRILRNLSFIPDRSGSPVIKQLSLPNPATMAISRIYWGVAVLISTTQFCQIVDIGFDRFEQRRLRERAAADLTPVLGDGALAPMPIAPSELGHRGEYDGLDAVRLRAVIQLERCGMAFGAACRFVRGAGVGPDIMFPSAHDIFAAQWLLPGSLLRRFCGDARDLARAMSEAPLGAVRINFTTIRDEVARRAVVQLGLNLVGTRFERPKA